MNKLKLQEINESFLWEDFISKHGQWNLFQSFAWGEVEKKQGAHIYRFGVFKNKKIIAVAQVKLVNAKRGIFLEIRQGPVFGDLATSETLICWNLLLDTIKQLGKKVGAWFIRLGPMIEDSEVNRKLLTDLKCIPAPIHAMNAEVCWILDLEKPEVELLQNMRKTTRYLIRQAEKLRVTIEESKDIECFLNLYYETAHRHGFVPHKAIAEEFEIFSKKQQAILLLGKHEGKVLAGAIILFFGSHAIYHHGASISSKIPASYLLQWAAIKIAKERHCSLYNFWGIVPDITNVRHPWRGITLFKQGFGGREMRFFHAHDLPLSPLYKISYTIELVRKIKRGY